DFIYFLLRRENTERWIRWPVFLLNVFAVLSVLVPIISDDYQFYSTYTLYVLQPMWIPAALLFLVISLRAYKSNPDARYLIWAVVPGILALLNDVLVNREILPWVRIGHWAVIGLVLAFGAILVNRFVRFQNELETVNEELLRLDRIKDEFLSNVSHELNTPITSLLLIAEEFKHSELGEQTRKIYIEQMNQDTRRLADIIRKLLLSIKLESGDIAAAPGATTPEKIQAELLERYNRQDIPPPEILWSGLSQDRPINLDEEHIASILYELVDNAVLHGQSPIRIHVQWMPEKQSASFRVRDAGNGAPSDTLAHLTEKFYRVDSSLTYEHHGTGLGLYIAARLAQLMSARIEFRNQTDGFEVELIVNG
ncbi:MAG: HAMP domain-containing histidine kinase, partial [Leptospiraceae bacterium]|nr:HAMP domain-containing histidine kinase [Leptospiraceae bacterium]